MQLQRRSLQLALAYLQLGGYRLEALRWVLGAAGRRVIFFRLVVGVFLHGGETGGGRMVGRGSEEENWTREGRR